MSPTLVVVGLSLGAGGAAAAGAAAPSFLGALPPLFLRVFLKWDKSVSGVSTSDKLDLVYHVSYTFRQIQHSN